MKKLLKIIVLVLFIIVSVRAALVCFDGYVMYKSVIQENPIENRVEEVRNQADFTELENISSTFTDAILSVEDSDYYNHGAVSLKSFIRAVIVNFINRDYSEGGSTITQQTAKNLCFTMDKHMERKVAELFVARDLEKMYSKDNILEIYVNIIYYGDGHTGIYDASQGYFGKNPIDLDLNESTLLAGLPQAPSVYALSNNREKAIERRKTVVESMLKNNKISRENADLILSE